MKNSKSSLLDNLLAGSLFYGTGGGGNPTLAKKVFNSLVKVPKITPLKSFNYSSVFITVFGVGGLSRTRLNKNALMKGLATAEKVINTKISGIIPVEIGPLSLALAFQLARDLSLPIIDADFVGGRSTPEVFLETITLFDINRTPLTVVNNKGKIKTLVKPSSFKAEEDFLRNFAKKSGGSACVFGYPINKKVATNTIATNTISQAIKVGQYINNNQLMDKLSQIRGKLLYEGKVNKIKNLNSREFTEKLVSFNNSFSQAKLYLKNENLIFWIDNKTVLTCPDLIILVDNKNRPIYNLDLKQNQNVSVIGVKSIPLWRSKKGIKLFNPKTFGYQLPPKLLK